MNGYALVDASNTVLATYRELPTRIEYPGTQRVLVMGDDLTGWTDGDHALVPHDIPASFPSKMELLARADADAETVRLRYITPGVGQSMTYLEKHNQAVAVEGLGEEAANALSEQDRTAQFPTLSASVGIEAATLWDCAQIVVQTYEAWAALSNQIERTRLMGKRAISLASDAAAAHAAYEAITWPQ